MSKIVVAKLVRLGRDGNKFSQKMIAEVERTNAKLDDEFIKEFNITWKTSGKMYIVDEKLTKERDEKVKKAKKEPRKVDESLKQENEKLKKQLGDLSKKKKEEEKDPELEAAREKYFTIFSKKPNALLKTESILQKIDDKIKDK